MGLVQIIGNGVWIILIFGGKVFVHGLSLCDLLNESRNNLSVFINPWVIFTPVIVEVALNLLHLFTCRLFSILLHAGINRGVYFQPTAIQIIPILLAPILQIVGDSFPKV